MADGEKETERRKAAESGDSTIVVRVFGFVASHGKGFKDKSHRGQREGKSGVRAPSAARECRAQNKGTEHALTHTHTQDQQTLWAKKKKKKDNTAQKHQPRAHNIGRTHGSRQTPSGLGARGKEEGLTRGTNNNSLLFSLSCRRCLFTILRLSLSVCSDGHLACCV